MVTIRNRARRPGRWVFDGPQVRAIQPAVEQLGWRIVGTWHSHPVSTARPSPGDIAGAFEGDLMLLIDCVERDAKLWRVGKTTAREIRFDAVEL
jgi:proteasome lid subunit RPN8/RPN11